MYRALFAALVIQSQAFATFGVGQKELDVRDSSRNRTLPVHVWYPVEASAKQRPIPQAGSPFIPVVAAENAPLAKTPAKFPLVLLSHGSGGKADKLFWAAQPLVRKGMIVLAVDHPGNRTGDNSADGMMRVWERPKDLTFALDRLLEETDFKSRIDTDKIAALGHSAGGTTVLLLAGARLSSDRFTSPIPNCTGTKDPYFAKTCAEVKGIDLKAYPKELVEGNYADSRVKAVVGLDPGMVRSFQPESLKKLSAKALVLIADRLNAPQDEIYSKEFATLLPPAAAKVVPKSFHMTFIQACKPRFPKHDPELKELCIENDRKLKIQEEVAATSVKFFEESWGGATNPG